MKNIRLIIYLADVEFKRWICNSRAIILCVFLVFVHMQIIKPLQKCTEMMGEKISRLEAFAALGNSGILVLIIPILFLVLMADFPQRGGIDLYFQFRCSKKAWILGQMLFAAEASMFLVCFLLISTTIMTGRIGTFRFAFSHAITHYKTTFPEQSGDYISQLIPENLYHQMTLKTAVAHTVILILLYFIILALILLFSALCSKKYVGILFDGAIILAGAVTCAVRTPIMWIFPMAHTIPWLHYQEYLSKKIFSMQGSYAYMILVSITLCVCCLAMSKRYIVGKENI